MHCLFLSVHEVHENRIGKWNQEGKKNLKQ